MDVIGKVRLARGEVAFYDDLSRIHLTLSRPTANVLSTMNTASLRRGVQYKRLELIAGTLLPMSVREEEKVEEINKIVINEETPVEAAIEEKVDPETEVVEEVVEEKIEEKETKKQSKTKATKKTK